jgi:uncharacterized membrane protein
MLYEMLISNRFEFILEWIEAFSLIIEVLAVIVILVAVIGSLGGYIYDRFGGLSEGERYTRFRHRLARSLLLGLEMLIAADIIRTVALEVSFESILTLGLLVLVRTFLSWSLVVEIEGYWPWQAAEKEHKIVKDEV